MNDDTQLKTDASLRAKKIARMRKLLGNAVRSLAAIERELMESKILISPDIAALAAQCAITRLAFTHLETTFGDPNTLSVPIRYRHETGIPDDWPDV
jgi:hypothetical protein